ncbi:MAG: proline dehydrogenase family protein [Bacteroidetes bacterium]|nr:proline dehydrogenase family protein [Bacteroidota bacterium]
MNFENTQIAFAEKNDIELKKAFFLFSLIRYRWLTRWITSLVPRLLKWNFPVEGVIRKTIFAHFTGGATLYDAGNLAVALSRYGVQTILDYGVEGGGATKQQKEDHAEKFIRAIEFASEKESIPYVSVKISAFASPDLMEKINAQMLREQGSLMERYQYAIAQLDQAALESWRLVEKRLHKIIAVASLRKMKVLVDAEESSIQEVIDALVMLVMPYYNRTEAVVYHTLQLYRKDRLAFLKFLHQDALANERVLGVKLVRGAYMEKERARAAALGVAAVVHENKQATDDDFNAALDYCLDHIQDMEVVLATHNEESCLRAVRRLQSIGENRSRIMFHFSQLFGMSDHITFNLSKEGFSASKYVPYGPVREVIPYLMRRAKENTSVGGQSSRELELIKKELNRRKCK